MNFNNLFQPGVFIVVLIALAIPLSRYMTAVLDGSSVVVRRIGRPIEAVVYKLAGVDPEAEMSWKYYALAVLVFNTLGVFAVYAFLRIQQWLPVNPQGFGPMTPDAAFNTAISFVTNTNWQDYTPESTVSYLTQMAALTVQNFLSAATGIAVVVALIRGFARHTTADDRQLLGRSDAYHAVYSRAARDCYRARLRQSGRDPELRIVPGRADTAGHDVPDAEDRCPGQRRQGREGQSGDGGQQGRQADHRDGSGCVAGSDQDARHQRRRLFQRAIPRIRTRTRRRSRTSCR